MAVFWGIALVCYQKSGSQVLTPMRLEEALMTKNGALND